MWQPPLQGKSQQGQSDACHQRRLLPQLDLRNRILSVHLPSQCQRPVLHSLGESAGGGSSAVLLPETSLLIVPMYRVEAPPVTLLRRSVGAFLVPYLSCFFSPRRKIRDSTIDHWQLVSIGCANSSICVVGFGLQFAVSLLGCVR